MDSSSFDSDVMKFMTGGVSHPLCACIVASFRDMPNPSSPTHSHSSFSRLQMDVKELAAKRAAAKAAK
jgi:hypothetical protein